MNSEKDAGSGNNENLDTTIASSAASSVHLSSNHAESLASENVLPKKSSLSLFFEKFFVKFSSTNFYTLNFKRLVLALGLLLLLTLLIVILLVWYIPDSNTKISSYGSNQESKYYSNHDSNGVKFDVVVALKWLHQSQFAGHYVAEKKGLYGSKGLNVDFIPFDFENYPIALVSSGKADFGVAGADELILARSRGVKVKAIAVIFRSSPVCAFSIKDNKILSPEDFEGKKVSIERGTNVDYVYDAMLRYMGVNSSKIIAINASYTAAELINGSVDISTGYITNEPYYVISSGHDVRLFLAEDYGVKLYGDVIFTRDDLIENNPSLVYDFLSATMDGWQYALSYPEETAQIVLNYADSKLLNHEIYAIRTSTPLILSGTDSIGVMSNSGWDRTQKVLIEEKLLSGQIRINEVYTNEFIDLYHSKKCLDCD